MSCSRAWGHCGSRCLRCRGGQTTSASRQLHWSRAWRACFRGKLIGRLGDVKMRRVDVAVMRRRDAVVIGVIPPKGGISPGTGRANE